MDNKEDKFEMIWNIFGGACLKNSQCFQSFLFHWLGCFVGSMARVGGILSHGSLSIYMMYVHAWYVYDMFVIYVYAWYVKGFEMLHVLMYIHVCICVYWVV